MGAGIPQDRHLNLPLPVPNRLLMHRILNIGTGALLGAALLGGASHQVLAAGLAFGAAALLYLAVEELLVEAHEERETTLLSAMFFLGFLVVYVLGAVAG